MDLKVTGDVSPFNPGTSSVRCPACRQAGTFHGLSGHCHDIKWMKPGLHEGRQVAYQTMVGIRVCPNPSCRSVLFVAQRGQQITCYPPEIIDFDASNLPPDILASLEEAVKCHAAGCYRASALMIRRALEELCNDKKATGGNLKDRIGALKSVAVVPAELLSAADHLRLLGNDSAHIVAKNYDKVGEAESALAIELAKELLKAVYQYQSLVARLTALKKQP